MTTENLSLFKIMPGSALDRRRNWHVFKVFNLYRLILITGLLLIFFVDDQARIFGTTHSSLFLGTAVAYIFIVLLSIAGSYRRHPTLRIQVHIQTLVDIIALGLLIYASGGSSSSLTILLVTAIAASGILLPLYSALIATAGAFLVMLAGWLYTVWISFATDLGNRPVSGDWFELFLSHIHSDELGRLGIFGATFFIAVLLTYTLAERTRRSEALVRQRTQELLELAELNQAIVQHLQSGIMVVDHFARIKLMNNAAHDLLDYHQSPQSIPLSNISPVLSQRLANWISSGINNPKPFRQDEHLPDITPSFTHLGNGKELDTLIFLEDSAQAAQRLQHIKLAALGRLTASIAHEIRNPLASINHAAQLLEESTQVSANERRLGQIIHENARRANKIINNVLDLSRRDRARPEDVSLKTWLTHFVGDFNRALGDKAPKITLHITPEDLSVRFDPSHLQQVLWNLCNNALTHGQTPQIHLSAGVDAVRSRPFLDVIDFGKGVPEAEVRKIFEPFFTTQSKGTGLGLYLSREMCEANRAQLQYMRAATGGGCFRITFAHPGNLDVLRPNPQTQDVQWNLAAL